MSIEASLDVGSQDGRTLTALARDRLEQAIITGELPAGARLRVEHLAAALGMSPAPVREALRQLDFGGLVEHTPRRGVRVADLSLRDLVETYQARLSLEPVAIYEAALRFTPADPQKAEAALARLVSAVQSGDGPGARDAHTAFHFTLYEASGSRWLPRLIRPLWDNSERYRSWSNADRPVPGDRRAEHAALLQACARNDPEAARRLLLVHLVTAANLVARSLGSDSDVFDPDGSPISRSI